MSKYIDKLQENEDIFQLIDQKHSGERKKKESGLTKEKKKLQKIKNEIDLMNSKIPEAMTGSYDMSLKKLMSVIEEHKKREQAQQDKVDQIKAEIERSSVSANEWEEIHQKPPTWKEIIQNADVSRKRVLVNKLIERIDIRKDDINIRFKIDRNEFLHSRMSMDNGVPEQRL